MNRRSALALAIVLTGCATSGPKQITQDSWVSPVEQGKPTHKVYSANSTLTTTIFDYVDPNIRVVVPGQKIRPTDVGQNRSSDSETSELELLREQIAKLESEAMQLRALIEHDGKGRSQLVSGDYQDKPVIEKNLSKPITVSTDITDLKKSHIPTEYTVDTTNQVIDTPVLGLDIAIDKQPEEPVPEPVEVTAILKQEDTDLTKAFETEPDIDYVDVVSVFTDKQEALALMDQLNMKGDTDFFLSYSKTKAEWYVYMGRYNNVSDALVRVKNLQVISDMEITLATEDRRFTPTDFA